MVLAVASLVLTVNKVISPPEPLTLKKDLSVLSVIAPDSVAIACGFGDIAAPAVLAIAYLLNNALVDFSAPVEAGNIFDLRNILKAPLV